MKKLFSLALFAIALSAGPALAQSINGCAGGNCTTGSENTYFPGANTGQYSGPGAGATQPNFFTPINANTQGQQQGQVQGQVQGQGQASFNANTNLVGAAALSRSSASQTQGNQQSSNSGGNSLTVNEAAIPANTTNQVNYGGTYEVRNVPAVVAPNIYPTAPCMGSSSVGGSGVGFGFSVGTSWKDDDCGKRETSRSFYQMGLKEDALAVLCSSEYAATAPSCVKAAAVPAKKAETAPAPTTAQTAQPVRVDGRPNVTSIPGWVWKNEQGWVTAQ